MAMVWRARVFSRRDYAIYQCVCFLSAVTLLQTIEFLDFYVTMLRTSSLFQDLIPVLN